MHVLFSSNPNRLDLLQVVIYQRKSIVSSVRNWRYLTTIYRRIRTGKGGDSRNPHSRSEKTSSAFAKAAVDKQVSEANVFTSGMKRSDFSSKAELKHHWRCEEKLWLLREMRLSLREVKPCGFMFFCRHGKKMVARTGIEPVTHGFSVRCSTNWATPPLPFYWNRNLIYTPFWKMQTIFIIIFLFFRCINLSHLKFMYETVIRGKIFQELLKSPLKSKKWTSRVPHPCQTFRNTLSPSLNNSSL